MSAYDNVGKGSLKFKGGDSPSIKKKKKKSKSDKEKLARAIQEDHAADKHRIRMIEKTEAEKKFEEAQRKRQLERVAKAATKSHKEKVAEFNNKLEQLSEHYDIPKVGPG
ncbi:hypothetical protein BX666DRAFT_1382944 [Dichotomocladium elegans]|nr:hypothetical protein BX666DRAFT_1382944 [Dichotomocladium elegans]